MSDDLPSANSPTADQLRRALQTLLRTMGALSPNQTPCGQPIPLSQAHALMALLESGGLRQVDIARTLGLSTSATSRLLDQLERRGWVTRLADTADARAARVQLTEAGQRIATRTDHASRARFSQILSQLGPDSPRQILASLQVLNAAMAKLPVPATVEPTAGSNSTLPEVSK